MVDPMLQTGQTDFPTSNGTRVSASCLEIRAYRMLTRLARPAAPYILRFRERKGKEDPSRLGERLGRASIVRPEGPVVWVHAASVGETSAVLPLISELAVRRPEVTTLLTTGTVTSARFAESRLRSSNVHQYVPLDEPSFVSAFLDHWRPCLGIFTEQEVWPNLVLAATARRIPLVLVNARMSDRSFDRWQRYSTLSTALFSRFDMVLAQNEALARRFEQIGAQHVMAVGNLKIDAPPPPVDADTLAAIEHALAGIPRIVAASTHEGEEKVVAEAHIAAKRELAGLVTLIAPRHPDRGEAVGDAAASLGLSVRRRSLGEWPEKGTDIYVCDTIGELGTLYAASSVAFIGGSLITHGGQNPIEAVHHDAAVLTGPSTHNFSDAYSALFQAGGAVQVGAADQLAQATVDLIARPLQAEAMRGNARRALAQLSGALEQTLLAISPLLPGGNGRQLATGG
ncbi:MAG: 3-deoxy-D-manno-octulosonic acid transferase [Hyphomicrobiaceae bacterium]